MLNAILHGKKRGTGLQGVRLQEEFSGSEDTLSATVFERLFYLPDELVGKILFAQSIWDKLAPPPPTRIEKIRFWPWQTAEMPLLPPRAMLSVLQWISYAGAELPPRSFTTYSWQSKS
jgi:hypothetical protein